MQNFINSCTYVCNFLLSSPISYLPSFHFIDRICLVFLSFQRSFHLSSENVLPWDMIMFFWNVFVNKEHFSLTRQIVFNCSQDKHNSKTCITRHTPCYKQTEIVNLSLVSSCFSAELRVSQQFFFHRHQYLKVISLEIKDSNFFLGSFQSEIFFTSNF